MEEHNKTLQTVVNPQTQTMEFETPLQEQDKLKLDPKTVKTAGADVLSIPVNKAKKEVDPQLVARAEEIIKQLLSEGSDETDRSTYITNIGMAAQQGLTEHSRILDQSIKMLSKTEDGGPVARSLLDLRNQVEDLNPRRYNLTSPSSFIAKLFRNILGRKNPISRYFEKYEKARGVINDIVKDLIKGAQDLRDDSITLTADKKVMRKTMEEVIKTIEACHVLYDRLKTTHDQTKGTNPELAKVIEQELLFPLNQRIIDLQTTLTVNQQGIITYEMLVANNNLLITGVNRTTTITVCALRIAVTTRFALNKQKQVLDATTAVSETTENMIVENAQLLKTQGTAIHKQASEAVIKVDKMINAYETLSQALQEVENYKTAAIPVMRENISKMNKLTAQATETIERMERGTKMRKEAMSKITELI